MLLADSRQIVSDAGGGLSGGYEVRGPVSKEVRDPDISTLERGLWYNVQMEAWEPGSGGETKIKYMPKP